MKPLTMTPERVWLVYTDEVYVAYHNDDQPWPCYVPEARALAAEAEVERLRAALATAERELKGQRSFNASVDEALNSGDGSYRP